MVRWQIKNRLEWPVRHKWLAFFFAIVLIILGFIVYEKIALEMNRLAFKSARHAIDTVYADIVKQLGPPDNSKTQSECSKSYFGPYKLILSCSVDTDFAYGLDDKTEANKKTEEIRSIIKSHSELFKQTAPPNTGIYPTPAPGYVNTTSSIDYYKTSGLLCIFKYVFDSPSETFLTVANITSQKIFYVASGCSDNARSDFYPLTN